MRTERKLPCYGNLFPDPRQTRPNEIHAGKAFSFRLNSAGIGVQSTEVNVLPEEWEKCTGCWHYRSCYDLSMARLALAAAVGGRP